MTKHTSRRIAREQEVAAPHRERMAARAQGRMLEIPEKEAIAMLRQGRIAELESIGKAAIPFLERMAKEGRHPKTRKNAIEAIAAIGDKASIPSLAGIMGNNKEFAEVRVAAAGAISEIGDASCLPLFHEVLRAKKVEEREKKAEPSEEEVLMGEYVRGMVEMSMKALVERLLDEEKFGQRKI